jgi:thiamine pyrophosphokinase
MSGGGWRRNRVEIQQHSRDKDETDLELALHYACTSGYREILVVGALGGRLDQTLGNLSLLTNPEFAMRWISAWMMEWKKPLSHATGARCTGNPAT